jgi:hypothetical protein
MMFDQIIRYASALLRLMRARQVSDMPSCVSGEGGVRPGPRVIKLARKLVRDRSDVVIAPLETHVLVTDKGVAVRAWYVIANDKLPIGLRSHAIEDQQALGAGSLLSNVFFLCASYGLQTTSVAQILGLSRRRTRRLLAAAIARLDQAGLDRRCDQDSETGPGTAANDRSA